MDLSSSHSLQTNSLAMLHLLLMLRHGCMEWQLRVTITHQAAVGGATPMQLHRHRQECTSSPSSPSTIALAHASGTRGRPCKSLAVVHE